MGTVEARAVGAGQSITVAGKDYHLTPLSFRALQEIQQEALRYYRRNYIQTFRDNAEALGMTQEDLANKAGEAARWTVRNLPRMVAYSARNCPLTEAVRQWVVRHYSATPPSNDAYYYLLNTALDAGDITPETVLELTGVSPESARIVYDLWWVTSDREGMCVFVLAGLRPHHPDITKAEIGTWPTASVVEAARLLEFLTAPDVGNM